jgi:hypothetical protein
MENDNGTKKRIRNVNMAFRVTEEERGLIAQKMKLAGISSVRAYLLKMAVDGYVVQLDLADVREMVRLLRGATNNLNQIARRVNASGSVYRADIEDLKMNYERLWEKAGGILRQLARL